MEDLDNITNLNQIRAFLQQRAGNLHDSIISYYEKLGNERYTVKTDIGTFREPECSWSDQEGRLIFAFEIEFGSKWNLERAIARLLRTEPKMAVIVMSSRARGFTYNDLKFYLINMRTVPKTQKFLIFDIETGKNQIIACHSSERKKLIKGRRHEHKEQD